jgi:hypothetical protein
MADIKATSLGGTPFGNTANRPSSPSVGQIYHNGEIGVTEIYTENGWVSNSAPPAAPSIGSATNVGTARAYNNGAATIAFSNAPGSPIGFGFTLVVVNAGAYAITWPASVDWVGGSAPILTSSGTDVLVFYTYNGGTTYYGFVTGKNLS